MRRILIVSPHFPPVNAPDMQRVRLALPYLRSLGWDPVVLAIHADSVEGAVVDPLLLKTYPADIRVIRIKGISPRLTRWAGVGNLWWRCGGAFRRAGERLLGSEQFDLVFFSTTQFSAFALGPRWLKKFGVPYVLDYQDPWINPYYLRTGTRPPGGPIKFALSQWVARYREPQAVRTAAEIVAVSGAYGSGLQESYPWFDAKRVHLLPFGASPADFVAARSHRPAAPLVDFGDGNFHHVYAGRCGPDMSFAMTVLFRAFSRYLKTHPQEARRTRFHFIGTDYAPPPLGRQWAVPIANAEGVTPYVTEHCYRVPYFDALYYLLNANALVAVGSNDPTYSASKVFPYMLARRPLLLIYHHDSPVMRFAREANVGTPFGFGGRDDVDLLADQVYERWFVDASRHTYKPFDEEAFRPFSAETLSKQLAGVFDRAADTRSGHPNR
jgi:hypothetical protein